MLLFGSAHHKRRRIDNSVLVIIMHNPLRSASRTKRKETEESNHLVYWNLKAMYSDH